MKPACRLALLLTLALCCFPPGAAAHPGSVDKQGGHTDQATGLYHCHAAPCASNRPMATRALQEARQENRPFSPTYRRKDWAHWSDLDNDCQNTRAEVLIAHSQAPVRHYRNNRCFSIVSGLWVDPYTGIAHTDARQLDIDHRIALSEAHRYGGARWNRQQKEIFANDPLNLVPVERTVNNAKSDLPAYRWMPKNLDYWCGYIHARQAVAKKYALAFPPQEEKFNRDIEARHCQGSTAPPSLP